MEEFQVYFELADQKANAAIADLLSFIQAVGPSAGVILVRCRRSRPASARATWSGCSTGSATTTPSGSRSSAATGTSPSPSSAATPTPRASTPPRCPWQGHQGVGYLYGAADETPTVRHLPRRRARTPTKIIAAARVLRERAGTIAGFAAGPGHRHRPPATSSPTSWPCSAPTPACTGRSSPNGSPPSSPTGGPTRPPRPSPPSAATWASPASTSATPPAAPAASGSAAAGPTLRRRPDGEPPRHVSGRPDTP